MNWTRLGHFKYLLILAVSFLTAGCLGTAKSPIEIRQWVASRTLKALAEGAEPQAVVKAREKDQQDYLAELDKKYGEISVYADGVLAELQHNAEHASDVHLALAGTGIASGIAGAALLVASSANAVSAAICAGITTGVLAFETRATTEGVSRDAFYRVHEQTRIRILDAEKQYLDAYNALANLVGAEDVQWSPAAGKARTTLMAYQNAARFRPLPMPTQADVDSLQKQIDQLKAALPPKKEPAPPAG